MTIAVDTWHLIVVVLIGILLGLLTGKLSARWIIVGLSLSVTLALAS
ncbi:hypothetical protein [Sphingomonas lacusdianchii]|nr:hypothetical protein [Sphingomonas sp. JXJ CY 53]